MTDIVKTIVQDCGECIIKVEAFRPWRDEDGWMYVQVVSNHHTLWMHMWRNRVRNAWKVLRGNYDWSGFEVHTGEEAQGLIYALTEVGAEAFPSSPIKVEVTSRRLKPDAKTDSSGDVG